MTLRTVNEETATFSVDRILGREDSTIRATRKPIPNADRTVVTIERQGEIITGTLNTLSQTNLSLALPDGGTREIRQADIDYFYVPTLTIAINQERADQAVKPGDEVRIAFVEGTDITAALDELNSLEDIPVPLQYADGEARAVLVGYPDVDSALEATGSGEVSGLVYLAARPTGWPWPTGWKQIRQRRDLAHPTARVPARLRSHCQAGGRHGQRHRARRDGR